MTDIYDQASHTELMERESLLEKRRADAMARERVLQLAGAAQDCHDCGDPIPADRQAAAPGCTRCVPCEQTEEAQRKLTKRKH